MYYYYCYIFFVCFLEVISLNYTIAADDYLIEILVNGIQKVQLSLSYNYRDEGEVEANQRDLISFKIKNGQGAMGLWANLNFSNYIFIIGTIKQPFLKCNKTIQNLTEYKNCFMKGYIGNDNEINYFNFSIPKIIEIENPEIVNQKGVLLDLSELGDYYTNLVFTLLPINGILKVNGSSANLIDSYSTNSSFHYQINSPVVTYDQITYILSNSRRK